MNTQKAVYKKLFTEKTELETHKIELGAIDDFEQLFKKALDDNTAINLISALRKGEEGFEKAIKLFQEALKEGQTIQVLAKDLGIDIPKEIENKIKSCEYYIKEYNKYISSVKKMYGMF
tara:strand:+ start:189 stop:545 length:357 start_codon:yes stop_codon:yes gene_type:complete